MISEQAQLTHQIPDPSVQEAVMKILKPDPKLAGKDSWQGIITQLWPNTKYIDVIVTDAMSPYIPTIVYYGNGISRVHHGLYRYRVGDALRVAGFKNKAPQFNFICRQNVVLSTDSDRTDEVDLQKAVKNAANNLVPFQLCRYHYNPRSYLRIVA
ncbi:hypothetical protein HS088_TW19G00193 [Tripterygium wilfordii]|uniref:GH3 middle domain-containing protein n=1 Tax=Tripterygium wilfordii TaxID=458696 RepID=A0A7J7C8X5_TRIWF|nr:hypothetical protein HS088_TW19G00193 [Tripterygium wilfordii]